MIIDTHAHLYASDFKEDIDAVKYRAIQAGLQHILLPNIDVDSIDPMNVLVDTDPKFFKRMMGLHPCSVDANYIDQLARIHDELLAKPCIAVGEIGIDLYWDQTYVKEQEDAFLTQCQWALDHDLPIVIHSRNSTDLIVDLIHHHYPFQLSGVFHCFVGDSSQAHQIIDMGFYLGLGGVLTFKNSDLRSQIHNVPIDNIILETDAPYLAPVPFRGKRNESAHISYVAQTLSTVLHIPLMSIYKITTDNALQLFKL